jgi:hypothetical protein
MESKELLDYLGIEAEDLEGFKSKFSEKYFTEDQVFQDSSKLSKFTGRTIGKIQDTTLKMAKGFGVDVTKEDIKDKPLEEVFNHILEAKEDQHTNLMNDMKSQVAKGADDKYKSLQEEYEKALGKVKDYEGMNKELSGKIESTEKEWSGKLKTFKRNHLEKELFGGIDYAPEVDKYKRKGFESEIREKLRFDYDENDEPYVTDTEGNRIPDPKKHGTFKSPKQVLDEMAKEAGFTNVNPQGGKPVRREPQNPIPQTPQAGVPQPQEKPRRRINPRAMV